MQRLTEQKIILVRRKTRLEELVARHNTVEQARFYVEHLGNDFSDYLSEDACYKAALRTVGDAISEIGILQVVNREHVPNFMFGSQDIVVAVGPDGLVANTMKYLSEQPLIGVNPDPGRWDGVLLPFETGELKTVLLDVIGQRRPIREVTMAKAQLNDGQILYAVNDLFIGQRTHISSRYYIQVADVGEEQSSSGIIVSTGLGSTGWLKSIVAGASGVARTIANTTFSQVVPGFGQWNADTLLFTVREPFPSRSTGVDIVSGKITGDACMTIVSHMPENGVIFSDGIENDALDFRSGLTAVISVAERKGHLVF